MINYLLIQIIIVGIIDMIDMELAAGYVTLFLFQNKSVLKEKFPEFCENIKTISKEKWIHIDHFYHKRNKNYGKPSAWLSYYISGVSYVMKLIILLNIFEHFNLLSHIIKVINPILINLKEDICLINFIKFIFINLLNWISYFLFHPFGLRLIASLALLKWLLVDMVNFIRICWMQTGDSLYILNYYSISKNREITWKLTPRTYKRNCKMMGKLIDVYKSQMNTFDTIVETQNYAKFFSSKENKNKNLETRMRLASISCEISIKKLENLLDKYIKAWENREAEKIAKLYDFDYIQLLNELTKEQDKIDTVYQEYLSLIKTNENKGGSK